jgi:hypothetical protein
VLELEDEVVRLRARLGKAAGERSA